MSDNDYDLDFLEFELSDKYKEERSQWAKQDALKEAKEQAGYMNDCLSSIEIMEYVKEIPPTNDTYSKKAQSMIKEIDQKNKLSKKQWLFLCLHYQLNKEFKEKQP